MNFFITNHNHAGPSNVMQSSYIQCTYKLSKLPGTKATLVMVHQLQCHIHADQLTNLQRPFLHIEITNYSIINLQTRFIHINQLTNMQRPFLHIEITNYSIIELQSSTTT